MCIQVCGYVLVSVSLSISVCVNNRTDCHKWCIVILNLSYLEWTTSNKKIKPLIVFHCTQRNILFPICSLQMKIRNLE